MRGGTLAERATIASLAGLLLLVPAVRSPVLAQTAVPSMARCQQLMAAFDRYYPRRGETMGSTGSRLDRDVAEVECQKGRYAEGIRQLEGALNRNRIPIPPQS
jgi:hypothetical protein